MVTALAICEVVFRPNIHMVPVKTFEQQDIKALHCVLSPEGSPHKSAIA
jgi:hypothetical protein